MSHLRSADGIVNCSDIRKSKRNSNKAPTIQSYESEQIGLKLNTKTKLMSPKNPSVSIDYYNMENVNEYNYLGYIIFLDKENQSREIAKRVACILPVTTKYGLQTVPVM